MLALVTPAPRGRVATFPPAMTLFLLSILVLSVAAVLVTVRAVGQARDGFEDATGFHGETPVAARQEPEPGLRPSLGTRQVSLAS